MDKTYLPDLISGLEQELLRLGYTKGSMTFYRRRWNQLMAYAQDRGECYYTEQLGMDFLKEFFGITQEDFSRTLPQAETQEIRVIRMVGDFQLHHAVLRRYLKHKEILTTPFFVDIRSRFRSSCEKKGYSQVTTEHYVKQSSYLMDYLAAQGMDDFTEVTLDTVNAYIRTLADFSYKTVEQHICSLRAFFRFLYQEGTVPDDLTAKMPMVKARKQTAIPSVWTHEELKQLIGAIDRGSPKGRRDYAIILIACRLGLRCTDIKNLCFENFNWTEKKLCFTQSKTGQPIELPLVPDVGWAVIDYLKYGRPKVDSSRIFVRHMAPFLPFAEGDHLDQLIRAYMAKAHIPMRGKHRGMHSLRHYGEWNKMGSFSAEPSVFGHFK
uniref:tyrosine-type recombinase/integrase n=1 Tax=Enterocloster clostridioformis TaxID=1531 RepID=UPI000AE3B179|nr:tyrosine-type recombinase/integrase [Enterocloster clostridioformis]